MKNLFLKLLGPLLAIAGVLGLTGSSILWNFQGGTLGIPATVISLLTLAVGIVLLGPLQPPAAEANAEMTEASSAVDESKITIEATDNKQQGTIEPVEPDQVGIDSNADDQGLPNQPSLTTAESIAAQLAQAEAEKPEIILVNFAPEALRPGNTIRSNKRTPGSNLSSFRDMASELFKTN
jgi:hypothetical protein